MSHLILPPGVSGSLPKTSGMGTPYLHTKTSSKVRQFRNVAYWAENGRIWFEDTQTGAFESCSLKDFGARILALAAKIENWPYPDERKELIDMTGDAAEVIREAKLQGDPHNPVVLDQKLRHTKSSRIGGFELVKNRDRPAQTRQSPAVREFAMKRHRNHHSQ